MTEADFKRLAAEGYNRVPLVLETFADLDTPLSIYLKLANRADPSLLESVVGELPNEGSPIAQTKPVRRREDGSWLVDAVVSLEDFREHTGLMGRFPGEGTGHFTTVSGFVMRSLGRIPKEGDRVEALGMIFEVIDMDNHRLDKILVMPKALPRPA